MTQCDRISRVLYTASGRVEWARRALEASASDLHDIDAEAATRFAAEAERVSHLLDREPRASRRQAWS